MYQSKPQFIIFLSIFLSFSLTHCSLLRKMPDKQAPMPEETPVAVVSEPVPAAPTAQASRPASLEDIRSALTQLQVKQDLIEAKLTSLSNRIDSKPSIASASVGYHPAETSGHNIEPKLTQNDPDLGFINDHATSDFRRAKILFGTQKYSEAILAFSSFIEKYADHPLAGSAQFYIGESYLRQKEYKLAAEEFNRVLVSYSRSPHIPEAVRQLAVAKEALGQKDEAAFQRQQLLAIFPSSPAANGVQIAYSTHPEASPQPELETQPVLQSPATVPLNSTPSPTPQKENGSH